MNLSAVGPVHYEALRFSVSASVIAVPYISRRRRAVTVFASGSTRSFTRASAGACDGLPSCDGGPK